MNFFSGIFGYFQELSIFMKLLVFFIAFLFSSFYISHFLLWSFAIILTVGLLFSSQFLITVLGAIALFLFFPATRKMLTGRVMGLLKALKIMPQISQTEKVALEAGSTWIDAELFSGNPNFNKILREPYPQISAKEKAFIDNQCCTVSDMLDEDKAYRDGDLPAEIWDYMKKEKFFGLIIPEKYGGLGFSALGHSQVISALAAGSLPLTISTMVPNSLGPAELLIHYGTEKQKDYYLPRLATGQEIPCFGLTEVGAGSDAGSLTSSAVVFKGEDGKLYLRMNWKKRWITLGAVATVLGLAVKLSDPEELLGKGKDLGITCILVPSDVEGVVLGLRHDPLGVPFINSPIEGKDVVVSIDQIIGGVEGAGKGWLMLMECLAAGRSISLPSQATGGARAINRFVGTYAQVRHQFGLPIGDFEGVDEALARIGAFTYLLEASRIFTASAVDSGIKPAVVSAIAKYNSTEISRKIINDAMDILGGSGISQGPRNVIARVYKAIPIGITVEGANILTRTMIIFGQGAIRCHPHAYDEVVAIEKNDLALFDKAFSGHVAHIVKNFSRSILLSVTRGALAKAPEGSPMKDYYKKLAWASASFAIMSDLAMGALGGKLKFKEKLTGRFADVLSWMYLVTAALRRYEEEGRLREDEEHVHYVAQHGLSQIQEAFEGIYSNFDVPVLGKFLKYIILPWARLNSFSSLPNDRLSTAVARRSMSAGSFRDRLIEGIYYPLNGETSHAKFERAFIKLQDSKMITKKIKSAIKSKKMPKVKSDKQVAIALEHQIITKEEAEILSTAKDLAYEAVQVDSFPVSEYGNGKLNLHQDKPTEA